MKQKVLLVEDDQLIRLFIEDGLRKEGFEVAICDNGEQAIELLKSFAPTFVLLDINLKGTLTGFDIATAVRKRGNTPMIFTTSRDHIRDIEIGFGFGNCDYLKKPFTCTELIIRMKRILESHKTSSTNHACHKETVMLGEYTFYYRELTIKSHETTITLTKMENDLLMELTNHPGKVIDKQEIIRSIWGDKLLFEKSASLNNLICSLRNKLKVIPNLELVSIAKTGYKIAIK